MITPCILQSDFNTALKGAIIEEQKDEHNMNQGIIHSIEQITQERLRTICNVTDTESIKNQIVSMERMVREVEKNIISYIAPQINPHENVWFFRFWVKQWKLVQSAIFEELYRLYTFRHWTNEADIMEEKMTNISNEWKTYIIVEYGRNMENKELFIQRISLKETK